MAGKKITLDKEGISEILVADTDSEPCSETSDFENDFEEEDEEDQHHHHHHHQQQQQQASAEVETAFNRFTPNDPYMGCTAPLTSKRCILYIYSTNTGTEYFKHALHSPFFLFKMQFVS